MKKTIFTLILSFNIIFLFGQINQTFPFNVKGLNFIHWDIEKQAMINPGSGTANGLVNIVYEFDGEQYPEEQYTPYYVTNLLNDDYDEYDLIFEDDELNIVNIEELKAPTGYMPCSYKEVYYFNKDGNYIGNKVFQPNDPIIWDRVKAPYFTVIFFNKKEATQAISKETFWYRYGGGQSWEGYSKAQPTASQITSIRVGEYFWMENNFNVWDPFSPTDFYYNYIPFSEGTMENYFKTLKASDPSKWKELYNVTADDIDRDYGYYYENWGTYRLHFWGIFSTDKEGNNTTHPNGTGTFRDQYRLPYYEDVRQLYAMCPFIDPLNPGHTTLNERDIRFTLSPKVGDNASAQNFQDLGNPNVTRSYWFTDGNLPDYNKYNFNLMPAGWRSQLWNDWFYNNIKNDAEADGRWWMGMGGLAQMFYAVYTPVGSKAEPTLPDDVVTLAEHVNSKTPAHKSWKRIPFRWMRALTDSELGYKLYVKVTDLDLNSAEWTAMKSDNEIPLLIALRTNKIKASNVDIQKRSLSDMTGIDANYTELPKGYLRGFYVQYNIDSDKKLPVSQIATYACNVEDEVLGYSAWWQKSARTASVEETKISTMKVYPNPVTDILNIETASEIKSVKVTNSTSGYSPINVKNVTGNTIDMSNLTNGIYVVKIETADGVESFKVVKK